MDPAPVAKRTNALYRLATGGKEPTAPQPRNFFLHVAALGATKTGDGLIDPKLVLSWVLGALGAPSSAIGFLVPVREAGALLPQLALSARIRSHERIAPVWVVGAIGQGLTVLGLAAAVRALDGAAAGWTVVGLLALFALFRSVCSVTYKPLQGVTLAEGTRGTATGLAGSISSALVLSYGVLLAAGVLSVSVPTISAFIVLAGGLWLLAAWLGSGLREERHETQESALATEGALGQLRLLRSDPQLGRFVAVRGLLVVTALGPPYLVTAGRGGAEVGQLGPLVIAASLASVLSAYVWGRLSDRSSRRVLAWSGLVAAVPLFVVGFAIRAELGALRTAWALPAALFALMVAYQGVRLGRSTHLIDMAPAPDRAAYTAVSNSVVGVVMILGGGFGWAADALGPEVVLLAFGACSLLAAVLALGLDEVQNGP